MAEDEKELHFTVMYRGKPLPLQALAGSTLGDLGNEIVGLTGVAPHTLRLILPKRPPLLPTSEQHSAKLLCHSGITEGLKMTMMGSSSAEVAAVSQPFNRDRIIGFSEEDQRARQRSGYTAGSYSLPTGNYIFCDFQTVRLPGIELSPSPEMALKIMHRLASDRGISAIMNKYRWRVGIMTEMAPIGYVGISPECVLGFNKNRGQEISLRLRTDDLKGFRKYESIKKTLLHELAHMIYDEHDEKFHALDKKLNEESIALDWTKSHGHTLSRVKFEDEEEELTAGGSGSSRGYKLGGRTENFLDPKTAAAAAALRRFGDAAKTSSRGDSSQTKLPDSSTPLAKPGVQSEPDPDEQGSQAVVVIATGPLGKNDASAEEITLCVPASNQGLVLRKASIEHVGLKEPDPDASLASVLSFPKRSHELVRGEASCCEMNLDETMDIVTDAPVRSQEPDPDTAVDRVFDTPVRKQQSDPDEAPCCHSTRNEADPEEAVDSMLESSLGRQERDPDASGDHSHKSEPDLGEVVDILLDSAVKMQEQDPDASDDHFCRSELNPDASSGHSSRSEPDPDASGDHSSRREPDPDASGDHSSRREPDPDASGDHSSRREPDPNASGDHSSRSEPDPDASGDQSRRSEPDPDASGDHSSRHEPDPDEAVGIAFGAPVRKQYPNEVLEAHRNPDECLDCGRMACKRMKSSTGGGLTELAKPQMSR